MAKQQEWSYSQNFIARAIRDNYSKALKVAGFHFHALTANNADADIAAMLVDFTPLHDDLLNATSGKGVSLGKRKGDTSALEIMLKNMVDTNLPDWQQAIRNTYKAKSTGYLALFPQGNAPFSSGSIDNRINTLKTLKEACALDTALAAVTATITTFYTALVALRGTQEGGKSTVMGNISTQKDAITAMCIGHFANHGKIIGKYPTDPIKIESFTDVVELQNHTHDNTYIATLNPMQIKKVLTHKFTSASMVAIHNTGTSALQFWITNKAANPIHPAGITVAAGAAVIVAATALGDVANRILMVMNTDVAADGSYEVTV